MTFLFYVSDFILNHALRHLHIGKYAEIDSGIKQNTFSVCHILGVVVVVVVSALHNPAHLNITSQG